MVCKEIIRILEQQFPVAYACDWDNPGLLAGSTEKKVHRIYVALDATDEVIEEAIKSGADMLLTHHPLIFKGLKKVNSEDFIGRRVIELIKHDIAYYAMHTNFDIFKMADLAAERMQLTDTSVLQVTGNCEETPTGSEGNGTVSSADTDRKQNLIATTVGIGKVGSLPYEMTLEECAEYVKKVFDVDRVKVFGCSERKDALEHACSVHHIAICPGSGKSVIDDALKAGAQVLVTGDIDHHEGIDAVARGMAVIDAGHYGLEKIFIPYMKQYLEEKFPGVEVTVQKPGQPYKYI